MQVRTIGFQVSHTVISSISRGLWFCILHTYRWVMSVFSSRSLVSHLSETGRVCARVMGCGIYIYMNINIYVYIHRYRYMHMYVYIRIFTVHIHIYRYRYRYLHMYMYIRILSLCIHTRDDWSRRCGCLPLQCCHQYTCMYVCMHARLYVRTYVCMYIHTWICFGMCINLYLYIYMYICLHVRVKWEKSACCPRTHTTQHPHTRCCYSSYTVVSREAETTVFDPASVFLSTLWWSQQPSLPVLFL